VVLRRPDGSLFAVAPVDDFDVEVELLKSNPEFMAFLKQLSQEEARIRRLARLITSGISSSPTGRKVG
jgi:hypothetical protein